MDGSTHSIFLHDIDAPDALLAVQSACGASPWH
jgi:hypothetical protein